ncbi:hypothetical protein [Flammeovirga sp. SJP92]|uniref:hypothetical protein n=1 Tax=Flammeovirga sp. SJP92 TaxID=1775430 RepID=UPI000788AE23|nr:hypothetical protein [Flammeovirga sp. SJP92]KXX70977.1 hypothetical protein AVL50_10245 [Flammeovirga sp. SJP92]
MKKTTNAVLLLILFFLSTSNLLAQKVNVNDYWDYFFLDASLVHTNVHYDNDPNLSSSTKDGWRFGTGMLFNQGKYFSWEIGIGISKKRFENQLSDGYNIVRDTEIFSWDIPLIFHPQITLGKHWAISADIGMAYENRYKGSSITTDGSLKIHEEHRFVKKENSDPSPGFKKHDAYAIIGAGIRFRNVKFSVQHNFGIVDMDANKFYRAYMRTTMFKLTGLF